MFGLLIHTFLHAHTYVMDTTVGFSLRNLQVKLSLQEDVALLFCIWGTGSPQVLHENVIGTGSTKPGLQFGRKPGHWVVAGRVAQCGAGADS